jgi:outer membrane putative beta-barrel porin/alpha-amylase
MARRVALLIGVSACLSAAPAFAHHPGSSSNTGSAGPIVTISASTLEAGHGAVAFLAEYIRLGGIGDPQLIDAVSKHIHAHSIRTIESYAASAAYGITDDLMISARFPYVRHTDIREGHHAHGPGGVVSNTVDARGDAAGLGDITVLGQWRFFKSLQTQTEMALLVGFKAPSGRTDVRDAFGALFETEFQPGSGAWDGLLGAAFTQRFGPVSFDASVLGVFAGDGAQNTNLGSRFLLNAAVSYRVIGWAPAEQHAHVRQLTSPALAHSPEQHSKFPIKAPPAHTHGPVAPAFALDLILELNGEWHDYERTFGVAEVNSGGTTIYISPGVRASYGGFSAFATVGLPVYNRLNGIQSEPTWRVFGGVAYAF